jgi:hypothetical protein
MPVAQQKYNQEEKLRSYSNAFSRMSLLPIVETGDFSLLNMKIERDKDKIHKKFNTYSDYLKFAYAELCVNYRNEYLYKNTLITDLLSEYGTKDSILINEFRVGNSIADMVLFNGTSKAFEIKTELDSDKRLNTQLSDYSKIFRESYIVIHESMLNKYKVDDTVGIISLSVEKRKLKLTEIRKAVENKIVDVDMLMRSIRTIEYKNIVQAHFSVLPNVGNCEIYEACKSMMKQIPQENLHKLLLAEIKKRKSNSVYLKSYRNELRQFCLSTNLSTEQYAVFNKRLNNLITI